MSKGLDAHSTAVLEEGIRADENGLHISYPLRGTLNLLNDAEPSRETVQEMRDIVQKRKQHY